VTVSNLTVEGPYTGSFTSVGGFLLGLHSGIYVSNGSARITNNHVTQIEDVPLKNNVDDGFGILVGSGVLGGTGTAVVSGNTVDNYMSVGIDVAHAGSSATITNNRCTGLGSALASQVAEQFGISLETGTVGQVRLNTVQDNAGPNNNFQGVGVVRGG